MTPAVKLRSELLRLGGHDNPPATAAMIEATEHRLGLRLAPGMADFYLVCDGLLYPTHQWIWDFYPLERLTRVDDSGSETAFSLGGGETALSLYEGEPVPAASLVHFCDVLIWAPVYLFDGDPGSPRFGHFFAYQGVGPSWLVARSFEEFVAVFVGQSDNCLLELPAEA